MWNLLDIVIQDIFRNVQVSQPTTHDKTFVISMREFYFYDTY
jgi:hypothetical protein